MPRKATLPPARAVKGITDDKFQPVKPWEAADDNPRVIANHLRMLQQEMRDGFDLLGNRLMTRLDAQERRLDRLEDQVAELRRELAEKRKAQR